MPISQSGLLHHDGRVKAGVVVLGVADNEVSHFDRVVGASQRHHESLGVCSLLSKTSAALVAGRLNLDELLWG